MIKEKTKQKTSPKENKIRPYWHVDAKWIVGILLTFVLGLNLLALVLFNITKRDKAVDLMTYGIAISFSRKGIDNASEIEQLREAIRAKPDKKLTIEQLGITITEKDLEGKSPREIRLNIFRPIAEKIYDGKSGDSSVVGVLVFLSAKSHQIISRALLIFGLISLVMAALLIRFADNVGRIGAPGVVLQAAALPGLLISALGKLYVANNAPIAVPPIEGGYGAQIGYYATNLLPLIVPSVFQVYLIAILIAYFLIFSSIVAKIILKIRKKKTPNQ